MAWIANPRVGLLLDDAAHHLGSVAEAVAASAGMIRDGCPAEALRRLNGALDALWVAAHGLRRCINREAKTSEKDHSKRQ